MNIDPNKPVTAIALVDCFDECCPSDVRKGLWDEADARHNRTSLFRLRQLKSLFLAFEMRRTSMVLKLEAHRDLSNATIEDIAWAITEIARTDGPTYLVVEHGEDSYAQAAGTEGRFVIESRTIFGEGFQHFRVARDLGGADSAAVIHYRQKCSKHPPRRCPLRVRESEVCSLADVERALLTYAATGARDVALQWRDVTPEMVKDFKRGDDDGEIAQINPE